MSPAGRKRPGEVSSAIRPVLCIEYGEDAEREREAGPSRSVRNFGIAESFFGTTAREIKADLSLVPDRRGARYINTRIPCKRDAGYRSDNLGILINYYRRSDSGALFTRAGAALRCVFRPSTADGLWLSDRLEFKLPGKTEKSS